MPNSPLIATQLVARPRLDSGAGQPLMLVSAPPYADDAGQGRLVSANTPIYFGDEYQGYIGIDISLARLIERLNGLQAHPGQFRLPGGWERTPDCRSAGGGRAAGRALADRAGVPAHRAAGIGAGWGQPGAGACAGGGQNAAGRLGGDRPGRGDAPGDLRPTDRPGLEPGGGGAAQGGGGRGCPF